MLFLVVGMTAALDLLGNILLFSPAFRGLFHCVAADVATFSTQLAASVILSSVFFLGAEQIVDHQKFLPRFPPWQFRAHVGVLGVSALAVGLCVIGVATDTTWPQVLQLAVIAGLRSVGRSAGYVSGKHRAECLTSLVELVALIVLATLMPLLEAYIASRWLGVALRFRRFLTLPVTSLPRSEIAGYALTSLAPTLYYNVAYILLPTIVTSVELLAKYRYVQTLIVPVTFLGALASRVIVIESGRATVLVSHGWFRSSIETAARHVSSGGARTVAAIGIYVSVVALMLAPLSPLEFVLIAGYTLSTYQRAIRYAQITVRCGAFARGVLSSSGVLLLVLMLQLLRVFGTGSSLSAVFAVMGATEATLWMTSWWLLRRARAPYPPKPVVDATTPHGGQASSLRES